MPVAVVTNSTHVFAHPPASPPESQVTHALGCVTHSRACTHTCRQVDVVKRHVWLQTCRHVLQIARTTQAGWLKIKKKTLSRTLWCAAPFPLSSPVYSEPWLISQKIRKQVQLSWHHQDSRKEWRFSRRHEQRSQPHSVSQAENTCNGIYLHF